MTPPLPIPFHRIIDLACLIRTPSLLSFFLAEHLPFVFQFLDSVFFAATCFFHFSSFFFPRGTRVTNLPALDSLPRFL